MSKYHKGLTAMEVQLLEKLADIEHQRWSDWQKYLHSQCRTTIEGGCLNIPKLLEKRWERQIKTDYKDLSESEKDSDREQVMRYWPLIQNIN